MNPFKPLSRARARVYSYTQGGPLGRPPEVPKSTTQWPPEVYRDEVTRYVVTESRSTQRSSNTRSAAGYATTHTTPHPRGEHPLGCLRSRGVVWWCYLQEMQPSTPWCSWYCTPVPGEHHAVHNQQHMRSTSLRMLRSMVAVLVGFTCSNTRTPMDSVAIQRSTSECCTPPDTAQPSTPGAQHAEHIP